MTVMNNITVAKIIKIVSYLPIKFIRWCRHVCHVLDNSVAAVESIVLKISRTDTTLTAQPQSKPHQRWQIIKHCKQPVKLHTQAASTHKQKLQLNSLQLLFGSKGQGNSFYSSPGAG